MSDEQSLAAAIHEAVTLRPHDAAWAQAFDQERARLQALAPDTFLAIEHIGSTAVPGLVAKPIIDILAGIASLEGVDVLVDQLCDNGYTTSKEFNASLVDRRWLMRWRDGHRTHHLHIVVHGSAPWLDRIAFRDALRSDADLARRYAALKADLAVTHQADREAYTEAKASFVRSAVPRSGVSPASRGPRHGRIGRLRAGWQLVVLARGRRLSRRPASCAKSQDPRRSGDAKESAPPLLRRVRRTAQGYRQ